MTTQALERWRVALDYLPADTFPARPDLGVRYPWRDVVLHTRSRAMTRRIRDAVAILRRASDLDVPWWVGLSGKDSRAVALLAQDAGLQIRAMSVSDDAAMPGEDASVERAGLDAGCAVDWIRPRDSVLGWLRMHGGLLADLQTRSSSLASWAFYEPLAAHRAEHGPYGLLWGLRAAESRGRRIRRMVSGPLYQHAAEGWRCAPICDWSTLDVHAYLHLRGHALHPVYLCIDPDTDPLSIRTDWWFTVGWHADAPRHYAWLRRWWPDLWRLAVEIDPAVRRLS